MAFTAEQAKLVCTTEQQKAMVDRIIKGIKLANKKLAKDGKPLKAEEINKATNEELLDYINKKINTFEKRLKALVNEAMQLGIEQDQIIDSIQSLISERKKQKKQEILEQFLRSNNLTKEELQAML